MKRGAWSPERQDPARLAEGSEQVFHTPRSTLHASHFWLLPFTSLTGVGKATLGIAFVLLFVGWYKNINLVLLLGYFLFGVVIVNGFLAGRRLDHIRGRARREGLLFAGEPVEATVTIDNPGGARWGVEVVLMVLGHTVSWFILRLPARRTQVFHLGGAKTSGAGPPLPGGDAGGRSPVSPWAVSLPGRGRHLWGPLKVTQSYPFGLSRGDVTLASAEETIVLPRIGRLNRGRFRRHLHGQWRQGERVTLRARPVPVRAPGEFYNLRGYQHGDSSRAIHWRTTARRGELTVVEFSPAELAEDLLLLLDPASAGDSGAFEEAVTLAATICWEWCGRRGDRLILAVARPEPMVLSGITGPEHARRVLECLAIQQPVARPEPQALTDHLSENVPQWQNPSLSVVVIAAGPSPLPALLRPFLCRELCALETPGSWAFYDPPGSCPIVDRSAARDFAPDAPRQGGPPCT